MNLSKALISLALFMRCDSPPPSNVSLLGVALPTCGGILVNMSRTFETVNYDQALDLTVRLGDCLPPNHLARFVVDSVAQLDLSVLYAKYGSRGGEPYAPEMLLGLLLYGYATRMFSSRKIERATYESVAFRFIAGNVHPDHDTLAAFRRTFLHELKTLFVHVLLLALEPGLPDFRTD